MVLEFGDIDLARLLLKREKARKEAGTTGVDGHFIRLYWQQMLQVSCGYRPLCHWNAVWLMELLPWLAVCRPGQSIAAMDAAESVTIVSMLAATQAQSTVTAEGLLMQCLAVAAHLTKRCALHASPRRCLQAVQVIHAARIVHADLKPANFLMVEGQLKLIDFGIAKAIQGDTTSISRESQVRLVLCCCLRPLNQAQDSRAHSL